MTVAAILPSGTAVNRKSIKVAKSGPRAAIGGLGNYWRLTVCPTSGTLFVLQKNT